MKQIFYLWLSLALSLSAWSQPNLQKRVTRSYVGTDIREVLKDLAAEAEAELYLGATVQGNVSIILPNVTLEEALTKVLSLHSSSHGFKVVQVSVHPVRYKIFVAPADTLHFLDQPYSRSFHRWKVPVVRMVYRLDEHPSKALLDILGKLYPDVEFTQDPTSPDLYARGTRENLIRIKRNVRYLTHEKKVREFFWMMPSGKQ